MSIEMFHKLIVRHTISVKGIVFVILLHALLFSPQVKAQIFVSESIQDVVQSIQKVVGTLQDFVGDAQGCRFSCPGGEYPVPNPRHVPSTNGCGAFGIKLDSEISVKAVTECCDEHDRCYDTCLKKKDLCDAAFLECLESVCRKAKKILSKELYSACKSTADIMYTGTLALGCKPYREAQKRACICQRQKQDL